MFLLRGKKSQSEGILRIFIFSVLPLENGIMKLCLSIASNKNKRKTDKQMLVQISCHPPVTPKKILTTKVFQKFFETLQWKEQVLNVACFFPIAKT